MPIYARLEALRTRLRLNKSAFAHLLGYAVPSYKPTISPGPAELGRLLCAARERGLSVDEVWLLLGRGPMERAAEPRAGFAPGRWGLPSLGTRPVDGFPWPSRPPSESASVTARLYRPWRVALVALGGSMSPLVEPGDLCLFDRRVHPSNGDVALVRLARGRSPSEEAVVRQWFDHGNALELRPARIGRAHPPLVLYRHARRWLLEGRPVGLEVEGVLVHLQRDLGGATSAEDRPGR
ncbi:MAG: S24 family peptidase [Planctomycetes bacterium]|nr:S24 family peptidase [Planctomycetota bacterium]